MEQNNLGSISNEILNPNIDLAIDYSQIGLDSIIENPVFKEIPVIKTLVAIAKTGIAIKQRFFVKKFLVFLKEFHSGNVNEDILKKFKKDFEDRNYRKKITEQILLTIEDLDSVNKSKILAYLFKAYTDGSFGWERFIAMSNVLKNLQELSYSFMSIMSENDWGGGDSKITMALKAKTGKDWKTGLRGVWYDGEAFLTSAGIGHRYGTSFTVTELGQDLFKYGISKYEPNK